MTTEGYGIQGVPRQHPSEGGRTPDDFLSMAKVKGFVKNSAIAAKHAELLAG